jgi:hypothetical protein
MKVGSPQRLHSLITKFECTVRGRICGGKDPDIGDHAYEPDFGAVRRFERAPVCGAHFEKARRELHSCLNACLILRPRAV